MAQETRCAAVGKAAMVTPISAMISWAERTPIPVISSSFSTAAAKGPISSSILVSSPVMSAARVSMRRSMAAQRKPWWSSKWPVSAWRSWGILGRIRPWAISASTAGSRCRSIIAWSICRPETPCRLEMTVSSLIWASSRVFSSRCFSRDCSRTRLRRYRVISRSWRIGLGWTRLGRHMPRSTTLASHTASSLSVLGRPGTFLTCLALSSQQSKPSASSR